MEDLQKEDKEPLPTSPPIQLVSSSSSGGRRFFPRELDFDVNANEYVAIYAEEGEERRFWVGKALQDILSTDSKRKKHLVQYFTAVSNSHYLTFEEEDRAPAKLFYKELLGKIKQVTEGDNNVITISGEDRDRFHQIGLDCDKENGKESIVSV